MSDIVTDLKQFAPQYETSLKEDNVRGLEFLVRLHRLATHTTKAGLNEHIITGHLGSAPSMKVYGYQYDAELAAFLGFSLQQAADATVEVIHSIKEGTFGSTQTFIRLAHTYDYMAPRGYGLPDPEKLVARLEEDFDYSNRLKAELCTLGRLGVAVVPCDEPSVKPVLTDSFFETFSVVPVD